MNNSFVWLIVDDGSTDNTRKLVEEWILDHKLKIEYYYQENAGKMNAHNYGVHLCQTELFMCLDSDDQLMDNAVEEILSFWDKHKNDRDNLLGIIAPRENVNATGEVTYQPKIPENLVYTTGRYLYQRGYRGETAMIFRTDILRNYPFPVQKGEKFISEVSAYDAMDEKYIMITYNHPLMKCEYRKDGYSINLLKVNVTNPKGVVYVNQQRQRQLQRFSPTLMKEYIAYSRIAKYSWMRIIKDSYYPFFCLLMLPMGYCKMLKILKKAKEYDT